MTVAELIAKLEELPPEAEVVCSGYGVPLPTLVIHDVSGYGDRAFLGLCTLETAEQERAFNASRGEAT